MKKSIIVSILLLSTSLFSMEHKNHNMQEMNHQNHEMNNTQNVNSDIPKDVKCPVCGMFVAKYANWAATIKTDKETFNKNINHYDYYNGYFVGGTYEF